MTVSNVAVTGGTQWFIKVKVVDPDQGTEDDPSLGTQAEIVEGTPAVFTAKFYDLSQSPPALVDPQQVALTWAFAADTNPTTWTYGVGAQIVKDAVGSYHADVPTDNQVPAGSNTILIGEWTGWSTDGLHPSVVGSASVLVTASQFPNPFG